MTDLLVALRGRLANLETLPMADAERSIRRDELAGAIETLHEIVIARVSEISGKFLEEIIAMETTRRPPSDAVSN